MTVIGVISDTHGLMRSEALEGLENVALIVHAGDIGDPSVIERLQRIAPIIAVRGNVDTGEWAKRFPRIETFEIVHKKFLLVHELKGLGVEPPADDVAVVIYGHSHRAEIRRENGVLYFNPGSIGPRRFRLPVTMGRLTIIGNWIMPEFIKLH